MGELGGSTWLVLLIAGLWLAIAAALIILFVSWIRFPHDGSTSPVSASDEALAAERLLAEKLSGPRYFNAPVGDIREDGGPWIEVSEAWRQLPQVAAERKMSPAGIHRAERLIEQTAEDPPSRIVGGQRINLSRLNLSLDSLKER